MAFIVQHVKVTLTGIIFKQFLKFTTIFTPWAIKNVALCFCQYLRRLLANFQNSFTGVVLCRQFATI